MAGSSSESKTLKSTIVISNSPTLSERSTSTSDDTNLSGQYYDPPPIPTLIPQTSGFIYSQEPYNIATAPIVAHQENSKRMPRSQPDAFKPQLTENSIGTVFEDSNINNPSSFSGRSPRLQDILLPGTEFDSQSQDLIDFEIPPTGTDNGEAEPRSSGEQVEEVIRDSEMNTAGWVVRLPSPSPSSSSCSSGSSGKLHSSKMLFRRPEFHTSSPEMLMLRFDKQTCGILSVKDGPTENPWRTLVWPMIRDSPALYHAIASMTAFHTAREIPALRVQGIEHMRQSVKSLRSNLGEMRTDAALATTLVLAFSESWDVHIKSGIEHLKGAKILVNQALTNYKDNPTGGESLSRLKFLINTWVYMDVIARLTSVDVDESNDFDNVFPSGPFSPTSEVDPLMGCALTLFPLIGRVANLVRKARKSETNSPTIVSAAMDLKSQLESWEMEPFFERPEDPYSEIQDSIQTAEAYRWATLLYLHQAVPEIPSLTSAQLAQKVMVYLATVPLCSRAVIVHIYPLLAAGCEATGVENRKWVDERWVAMSQRMWIGNIDRCREVVREVWDRRDRFEAEKASRRRVPILSQSISQETSPVEGPNKRKFVVDDDDELDLFQWPDNLEGAKRRATDVGARMVHTGQQQPRKPSTESYADENIDYETTVRGSLHWVGVMKDWNWESELILSLHKDQNANGSSLTWVRNVSLVHFSLFMTFFWGFLRKFMKGYLFKSFGSAFSGVFTEPHRSFFWLPRYG